MLRKVEVSVSEFTSTVVVIIYILYIASYTFDCGFAGSPRVMMSIRTNAEMISVAGLVQRLAL